MDRVARLEPNDPAIQPLRLLTKPEKEPSARQEPAEKLIWELQLQVIRTFNGERKAALIRTFQNNFMTAMRVMKMQENDTLMRAGFLSKLGEETMRRTRTNRVVDEVEAGFLSRGNVKYEVDTELRQDSQLLQWLVESFSKLRNQVEHKWKVKW